MSRYNYLSRAESVTRLRDAAKGDTEADALIAEIADYIEGTADDMGREAVQEIAMAYVAGYHHGGGAGSPQVYRALAEAGLRR